MNFELMSFLGGNIESAVQVNYTYNLIYLIKFLYLPFFHEEYFQLLWIIRLLLSLQSCTAMEQKELLEELAESVGVLS